MTHTQQDLIDRLADKLFQCDADCLECMQARNQRTRRALDETYGPSTMALVMERARLRVN